MKHKWAAFLLLLMCACNLNKEVATPTAVATDIPNQQVATEEISVTPLPGIATVDVTRTPFGNNNTPATQSPLTTLTALPNTFPTLASGERADITFPATGETVSSQLYLSGVVHNLTQDQFTLQVFDSTGQPLTNGQTISLSNPNHVADVPWSASVMVRSYSGTAQIRILAQTADGTQAVIGAVDVTISPGTPASSIVQPANGSSVASITAPSAGSTTTGDPINVTGTAGGIANNQFTLLLLDGSGTVLNSQVITLSGAEQNSVPWSAALGSSGYHGSAEIRAVIINNGQQTTLASVKVNLQ